MSHPHHYMSPVCVCSKREGGKALYKFTIHQKKRNCAHITELLTASSAAGDDSNEILVLKGDCGSFKTWMQNL